AEDMRLGRAVALKVLKSRTGIEARRLRAFMREMRVLRGLSHPNICKAYMVIAANSRPVMVMELLIGEPLSDHIPWNGSRKHLAQLSVWFYEAADALAYAHAQGVSHGDIHSQNLF